MARKTSKKPKKLSTRQKRIQDEKQRERYSGEVHTPSSGFSYSEAASHEVGRYVNPNYRNVPDEPNRDLGHDWEPEEGQNLLDDVKEILSRSPDVDLAEIDLTIKKGVVTLRGEVETRRIKRYIEDLIYDLPGVKDVDNRIRVTPADPDRRRMSRSLT